MTTQRLVTFLMVCAIAMCCSIAHAEGSDLIFIHTHGMQRVYTCTVNSLRQWPAEAAMDDGLLAFGCSEPIVTGPQLQRSNRQTLPANVSDRLWTVTLFLSTTEEVFHGCSLLSLGVEQGSTSVSLQCPEGGR